MSSIYVNQPPTSGKVVLHTTKGPIDIELWAKECPLAARNFVQLCMEGYYDGTIFHRVVRDFLVQGGDPDGTGEGGESVYGEEFADEFHQRLRFNHRGLVACASNGPNTNGSQFFITLGECRDLDDKHTIFGKVTGNAIYNVLAIAEVQVGADDRPIQPPVVKSATVVLNPFPDIVPRVLAPRLTPEERARKEREAAERKRRDAVLGKRNSGLLSFGGDDDDEDDDADAFVPRKRIKSLHDAVHTDRTLSSKAVVAAGGAEKETEETAETAEAAEEDAACKEAASAAQQCDAGEALDGDAELSFEEKMMRRMQARRKRLTGQDAPTTTPTATTATTATSPTPSTPTTTTTAAADTTTTAAPASSADEVASAEDDGGFASVAAMRAKYKNKYAKKRGKKREESTMAMLASFKSALKEDAAPIRSQALKFEHTTEEVARMKAELEQYESIDPLAAYRGKKGKKRGGGSSSSSSKSRHAQRLDWSSKRTEKW